MAYNYYGIYEAERVKSAPETRAADARVGELAAALRRRGARLTRHRSTLTTRPGTPECMVARAGALTPADTRSP